MKLIIMSITCPLFLATTMILSWNDIIWLRFVSLYYGLSLLIVFYLLINLLKHSKNKQEDKEKED